MRAKFLALIFGFCALISARPVCADAVVGQAVPAFTALTLDGKIFDLSVLKGKVVVLHFWATWCAPCREEMPALEAVYRQFHDKGLEVLAISADRPRAKDEALQVMHYFTFPGAMLNESTKNDLGAVSAIPVTYVIDKKGVVENILIPDAQPLTPNGLGNEVKHLIEAKEEAKPEIASDKKTEMPDK